MLDIIIVVGCILAGFAVGKYIENRINEKGRFYRDLSLYVSLLRDNVNGRQLELAQFNREFTLNSSKSFGGYLDGNKSVVRLTKQQKDNIEFFFSNLNCVSSQALVEHLDYYGKILQEDAKKVEQDEVVKSSIYGKLGMLLGAMIGILLV